MILCYEDHSLSFIQIKENNALHLIYKVTIAVENKNTVEILYKNLIVVRHAPNAYQVYLQGNVFKFGNFIEVFEVFIHPDDQSRVFWKSYPAQSGNFLTVQTALKD